MASVSSVSVVVRRLVCALSCEMSVCVWLDKSARLASLLLGVDDREFGFVLVEEVLGLRVGRVELR